MLSTMRVSRLTALALVVVSLLISPALSHADGEDYSAPPAPGKGYLGINANPMFLNTFAKGVLSGREIGPNGEFLDVQNCSSMKDPACAKMKVFWANPVFPMCTSTQDTNCIDGLVARDGSGKELSIDASEKFPAVRAGDYVGDPALQLPSGGQVPILNIPQAPHTGGSKYAVIINSAGGLDLRNNPNGVFDMGFQAAIFAVGFKTGGFRPPRGSTDLKELNALDLKNQFRSITYERSSGCIVSDATSCATAQEMPPQISFELRVRLNYKIASWFSGRFEDPTMSISKRPQGDQLLKINAKPIRVPIVSTWIKKSELSPAIIEYYASLPKPLGGTGDILLSTQNGDPDSWSLMRDTTAFNESQMKEYLLWLPAVGDKSFALPTLWSVREMGDSLDNNSCLKSSTEVLGFVATNASMYLEGPPVFSTESQSLEYKVAAPHLKPNGDVFLGTYDLQIKSDAARCLYGFTNAPISATVSVVSESGVSQVATTVVNEKDGWLNLSAKGFTFSAPILKVKFSQAAEVVVTPTPTPSPTATTKPVAKKITITCVKGKTNKKVTAIKPTCPTGYKKK